MNLMLWYVFVSSALLFFLSVVHLVLVQKGHMVDEGETEISLNMLWQTSFYLVAFFVSLTFLFLE